VLLALAQGLGGKEAADMLGISEPTVRSHLQHIFSKTNTPGRPTSCACCRTRRLRSGPHSSLFINF